MVARGIRLNNPGNIENDGDKWQGLSAEQPDSRFCKFDAPKWGIRALCKILLNYRRKYKLHTIREMVSRWAPPVENPTEAYIANVAKWSGEPADAELDLADPDVLARLAKAFTRQENGSVGFSDEDFAVGVALALK